MNQANWHEIWILDIIIIGLQYLLRNQKFVDGRCKCCSQLQTMTQMHVLVQYFRKGKVQWGYSMGKHWKIIMVSLPLAACSVFPYCAGSSHYAATWCSPFLVIGDGALLMWRFSEFWVSRKEITVINAWTWKLHGQCKTSNLIIARRKLTLYMWCSDFFFL